MTTKPLHKYLLLDTRGRFRADTQAVSSTAAVASLRASRKDKRIPKGWTIRRQPPAPPAPAPSVPPRPFQVGDRIRILAKHWAVKSERYFPAGTVLRLVKVNGDRTQPSFLTEPFTTIDGRLFEAGMAFTPSEYGPGEVELAEPAPAAEPTEPGIPIRPFRAAHGFVTGDRVEALPGVLSMSYPKGFRGVVDGFERGKVLVLVTDPSPAPNEVRVHAAPGHLRLLEHAPGDTLVAGAVAHLQDLAAQFQDALGMPEAGWPDMLARARRLSTEAEEDRREAITERERAEAAERDARACAGERDDALARLADLRAIYRVAELIPDWDAFQMESAIGDVLSRR